ncbi:hypothetical protein ABZ722_32995 [Streptomyces longwoodensis]|uniref:BlaI/MecI/CopY family transcriptional regulator n=1 Tax=Streptomyces longwoodensis TaxID=68231 RepID=UPI0033E53393
MATDLQSQYKSQFAKHLADNREEQATLRARLEQLVTDEAWLVKALEAVSAQEEAAAQVSAGESAQLRNKPAAAPKKKATAKKTTAKKAAAQAPAAKKTTVKKAAAKKQVPTTKKTAARTGEPSLGELLLGILGKHTGQPRSANEVVSDLEEQYPERARDINTVRSTLERLVAKSRIERTKQKHTVLYTTVDSSAEASPDAGTTGPEEGEKVSAQA